MDDKDEILKNGEIDLLFYHNSAWIVDRQKAAIEDSRLAWEALRLVPPEDWYAEQIASYDKNGIKIDWVEKTREAWAKDRHLLEREKAGLPVTFSMARHQQAIYPFLGADGQPQRVRLGEHFWVQPNSANPELAPRHSVLGQSRCSPEEWAARWEFRVHPLHEGEFLGVLRQWVSRPRSKTPELWHKLEEGELKTKWQQFVHTYPLRQMLEYRQTEAEADRANDETSSVGTLGEQYELDSLRTISTRLVTATLPGDWKTANYAKLRIYGLTTDEITDSLRPEYGGFAETAIIKIDKNSFLSVPLPSRLNWGHQANWYNKMGGIKTQHARWIEDNHGKLLFDREDPSRSDGKAGASVGSKKGRPQAMKYQGIPTTNEPDFVSEALRRYQSGCAGWDRFANEQAARKAARLAFRRLKEKGT